MADAESGYDIARILQTLMATLVEKNVLSQNEADYIINSGKGATFRQTQTGYEQTGQAQAD